MTGHDGLAAAADRVWQGVGWYLRQVSGQARWEAYLARCERDGLDPMSRRDYERHRTDHRERSPQSRCC